jgi:hypothetical protein
MKRPSVVIGLLAALATVLLIVGLIAVVVVPRPTTFNVTAETERVEMTLLEPAPSRWTLEAVAIDEDDNRTEASFSGFLELAPQTRVLIQRVALGPLWIHVECLPGCASAGRLLGEDETPIRPLPRRIDVHVSELEERARRGTTVLLPLAGTVSAGRTIGIETGGTTAMLRNGRVSMLGRSVFREDIFEAGAITLEAGDQFDVAGQTLGFVVADERPAMTAAYRAIARTGTVVRPGGGTYTVSASLLGRLFSDDLFRALSALLALAAGIATVVGFGVQVWPRAAARRKPAAQRRALGEGARG